MPHRVDPEEDFVPTHRHRTFTRYIVLSDGKTFDVLSECTEIEVPDDIDDVEGYIRNRIHNANHPTFDWHSRGKTG
jgi:hypothetical protein